MEKGEELRDERPDASCSGFRFRSAKSRSLQERVRPRGRVRRLDRSRHLGTRTRLSNRSRGRRREALLDLSARIECCDEFGGGRGFGEVSFDVSSRLCSSLSLSREN